MQVVKFLFIVVFFYSLENLKVFLPLCYKDIHLIDIKNYITFKTLHELRRYFIKLNLIIKLFVSILTKKFKIINAVFVIYFYSL
jgi:hypothetical protein